MSILQAVILGLVQGLTEFLPVSSSGHVVLGEKLLGLNPPGLTFDVMLHFGTVVAVIIALWGEVKILVSAVIEAPRRLGRRPRSSVTRKAREGWRLLVAVIVATIPVGVVGVLFNDFIEGLFQSVKTVGVMLLLTGTLLLVADRWREGRKDLTRMGAKDALFIGLLQILALAPGMSRSGTTISAGLMRGMKRRSAARFSFLISLPTILGATALELPELVSGIPTKELAPILIGTAAATVSGYAAIKVLLQIIQSRSLIGFTIYTWALGLIVLFS